MITISGHSCLSDLLFRHTWIVFLALKERCSHTESYLFSFDNSRFEQSATPLLTMEPEDWWLNNGEKYIYSHKHKCTNSFFGFPDVFWMRLPTSASNLHNNWNHKLQSPTSHFQLPIQRATSVFPVCVCGLNRRSWERCVFEEKMDRWELQEEATEKLHESKLIWRVPYNEACLHSLYSASVSWDVSLGWSEHCKLRPTYTRRPP